MKLQTMARAGVAVLKGKIQHQDVPMFVTLSVTSRCQARCSYCVIPERKIKEMKTEDIFRLIDEISAMGTQRLGLWGGEPLLRNDIGDILKYAREKNLYTTMISNGYLIPKKLGDLEPLDHLILSLDGPPAAHDLNREPGAHAKVMKAIDALPRHKTLWTITVLTRHNLDSIDYILDLSEEKGFVPTFQVLHHNEMMAGDTKGLEPVDTAYRRALQHLIDQKKKGRHIGTSRACFDHLIEWPDYSKNRVEGRARHFSCVAGRAYCNVDSDGSVYPCSILVGEIPAPNFLDMGFEAAYRSLEPIPCKSCLATCFTEYNLLFNMHWGTIFEWAFELGRKPEKMRPAVEVCH